MTEATTSNSNWRLLVWTLRRGHVDNSLVCRVAWLHKRDVFLGVLRAQRFKHTTSHEASLRFWGQAEVDRQPKPAGSVENDPQRTSGERDRFDGNKNVAAGIDHDKKTQKFVFRSALRPNQISFSHGQDPEPTHARRRSPDAAIR